MTTYFRAGDVAVLRYLWFGRPFWAIPTRVVEDTAGHTCVWVAPGTPYRRPPRLAMREIAANDWRPEPAAWFGNGALMFSPADTRFSIWHFRDDAGVFDEWYVNLELPWRRTPIGFDTRDHQLDIVVAPDGSWRWKDEDELRDAVEAALLTEDEAVQIRADGERLVASLPELVPTGYEQWRPDPRWSLPTLPAGWER